MSTVLTTLDDIAANVNSGDMAAENERYHHGDLRSAIERIAWQHVLQDGVDKLSLRACARAAEVDPAAVYRHFKSKNDIIAALTRRAFAELATCLESPEQQDSGASDEEILLAIGLAYVSYATDYPKIFAMMFDVAGQQPMEEVGGVSMSERNAYQVLQEALQRWRPGLSQQDVDMYSFTLWSAVHGLSTLFNAQLGPPTQEAKSERAFDVCKAVLRGCAAPNV